MPMKRISFFRVFVISIILIRFLISLLDYKLLYSKYSIVVNYNLQLREYEFIFSLYDYIFALFVFLYIHTLLSIILEKHIKINLILALFLNFFYNKIFFLIIYGINGFETMSILYLTIFYYMLPSDRKEDTLIEKHLFDIIRIHLCLVYFFAGLSKFFSEEWRSGIAILKAFNVSFSNSIFTEIINSTYNVILFKFISFCVILFELFYFIILIKNNRKVMLLGVSFMHISFAIFLNLYFFSAIMIVWNLAAFLDLKNTYNGNTDSAI